MATIKTIQYQCDVCNNKFTKKEDLASVQLPCKESDCEGRGWYDVYKSVDLCKSCEGKFRDIVMDRFCTVKFTLGNISSDGPKLLCKPVFSHNISDTCSIYHCKCNAIIKVSHDRGIMDNKESSNFCSNCGIKFLWDTEAISMEGC